MRSKSTPSVVDKVAQSMPSFPVTLYEIAAVFDAVDVTDNVTVGDVSSTVTVPVEAADKTPRASFAYALYVPSSRPVSAKEVFAPAVLIVT